MTLLLVSPETRNQIDALVAYAAANPLSAEHCLAVFDGREPPPGDNPANVIIIPMGYRCCFTFETHKRGRQVRHLSIGVVAPGKWPNPLAVRELLTLFGFQHADEFGKKGEDLVVYLENEVRAVDVIETR